MTTSSQFLPPALVSALAGAYELLQEIGRGGMGVVYAARDVRLERLVAIKVLPELVSSDLVRERFLREARAAARLSHPSIVPIYAADERAGVTFLVMAYVDGSTFSALMRDGNALAPELAVPILRDVALALAAAHSRNVIHRDVKPENILIDRLTGRPMVTDFGIARLADAMQPGALTRTGQVLGTVGYMSPEQVTAADVDGRSDLYSLGVVAFEALSGRLPFDGPAPSVIVAHATTPAPLLASVAPGVPAELCAVVDRCLRKNPSDRYANGNDLAAALDRAMGPVPTPATDAFAKVAEQILTEAEADRVWKRAAELQAGIGSEKPPRAPTAAVSAVARTATNGFRIEHVRLAAMEAGISAPYVSLALDELLKPRAALLHIAPPRLLEREPRPRPPELRRPVGPPVVRSLSPRASPLAGAPSMLIYEVEIAGELSPNDFDVIAHSIRTRMGEAGNAAALGRTLSWTSSSEEGQRRMFISIVASGGRTQVRIEENLEKLETDVRKGSFVTGLLTAGVSLSFFGGGMNAPVLGTVFTAGILGSLYYYARRQFTGRASKRAAELSGLAATLADQVAGLIADLPSGRAPTPLPSFRRARTP